MGIPGFASRIRQYGKNEIIGRIPSDGTEPVAGSVSQGWPCNNRSGAGDRKSREPSKSPATTKHVFAIVDGPSLAHAVWNTFRKEHKTNQSIVPSYSYAKIGKAAVEWVDRLKSYGFTITRIYFDGALPASKKDIRIARMEKQIGQLKRFRQLWPNTYKRSEARSSTPTGNGTATGLVQQWAEAMKTDLPPPLFLITAVIEALLDSEYAKNTWMIDGEADAHCAAEAYWYGREPDVAATSIFTNDSDLVVWNTGPQSRVVMIDELSEHHEGGDKVLKALQFWPRGMQHLSPKQPADLVQPAFQMLDPKVSFAQALADVDLDTSTDDFSQFSSMYWIQLPLMKITALQNYKLEDMLAIAPEPRVEELIHHILSDLRRQLEVKGGYIDRTTMSWIGKDEDKSKAQLMKARIAQEPVCCTQDIDWWEQQEGDGTLQAVEKVADSYTTSLWQAKVDMFLPVLFDDPNRATAWKFGISFRKAAETLALRFCKSNGKVFEYSKSGTKVVSREAQGDIQSWFDDVSTLVEYGGEALEAAQTLGHTGRWRFLIMQLTLADLDRNGREMPSLDDVMDVINGRPPKFWSTVHLSARYQAEFYSLRMLCEVAMHLRRQSEDEAVQCLARMGKDIPKITRFFENDASGISQTQYEELAEGFRGKRQ